MLNVCKFVGLSDCPSLENRLLFETIYIYVKM